MNVIYLLIFVCNLVSGKSYNEEEEEKYIDLLPEEEKRDFLEKVERRLLTSVKTKDSPYKSSGEISDDQLNEHTDFVRQVFQEESDSFRRQKGNLLEKKEKQPEETITVKGLEDRLSPHIDLTLRNGPRFRRSDENVKVTDENLAPDIYKIPVQTIYDPTTDKPQTETTKSKDEDLVNHITTPVLSNTENSEGQDIQVRGVKKFSRRVADDKKDHADYGLEVLDENKSAKSVDDKDESYYKTTDETTELVTTTTLPNSVERATRTTKIDTVETTSNENKRESHEQKKSEREPRQVNDSGNKDNSSVEKKEEIVTTEALGTLTTTTVGYEDQISTIFLPETTAIKKSTAQPQGNNNKKGSLRNRLIINADSEENGKLQVEDTTETPAEEPAENRKANSSVPVDISADNTLFTTESDDKIIVVTDLVQNDTNKGIDKNGTLLGEAEAVISTMSEETSNEKIETTTGIPQIVTIPPNLTPDSGLDKTAIINTTIGNSTKEISIISNLANVLRLGLELSYEKNSQKWPPVRNENVNKIKTYSVYEVSPNETPFVKVPSNNKRQGYKKKTKKIKQQPFYVPVYNYEPKNAYFNPYNNLGPNYEDTHGGYINEIKDRIEADNNLKSEYDDQIESVDEDDEEEIGKKKYYTKKHLDLLTKLIRKKIPLVVKQPTHTEIYFNPDEYLDVDYYFEQYDVPHVRSRKKQSSKKKIRTYLPATIEEGHPFKSMKDGKAKDHINAVRQLLYRQNIFGYVSPPTTDSTTIAKEENNFTIENNKTDAVFLRANEGSLVNGEPRMQPIKTFIILDEKNIPIAPNKIITRGPSSTYTKDISVDYYFGLNDYEKSLLRSNNISDVFNNGISHSSKNVPASKNKIATSKISLRSKKRAKKIHNKKTMITNKGTVRELLAMDSSSVLNHLDTLLKLNIPLGRRHKDPVLAPYMTVLKDMLYMDNEALVQYDWLGTAVDILTALKKLTILSENSRKGRNIHPLDWQLLKYVQYLYRTAKTTVEIDEDTGRARLPRNIQKKRQKAKWLRTKKLINRVWTYIKGAIPSETDEDTGLEKDIDEFKGFLTDMQLALNDLHTALKYISSVTKFKKQRWFKNLKELYLKDADNKKILEVILHIFTTRLINLIEESSKNGLGEGFTSYIQNNENDVRRAKDEFVLVLKVLDEIKHI